MKNSISLLKKIMLISGVFIGFSAIQASQIGREPNAKPNIAWNFELYNKSGRNIVFSVDAPGWIQTPNVLPPTELKKGTKDPLKGGKLRIANFDAKTIIIKIWLENEKNKNIFDQATKEAQQPIPSQQNLFQKGLAYVQTTAQKAAQKAWDYIQGETPSDFEYKIILNALKPNPFKPGKFGLEYHTAFLTWDKDNVLRPQTGTLKGWSGKTDSGLDNRNNINLKVDVIKRLKP